VQVKFSLGLILITVFFVTALSAVEYTKNPYQAMLYSTVVPGGGQFYNQSYIKSALVAGIQLYLIGYAIYDSNQAKHYSNLMSTSTSDSYYYYRQQRNSYRKDMRSDVWWVGTTLMLSVADAFVDAHLYNFKSEKNKVHLKFEDKQLQLEYGF
jgi:hypothetical protein